MQRGIFVSNYIYSEKVTPGDESSSGVTFSVFRSFACRLRNGDERGTFVLVVADDALRLGIQCRNTIDEELVAMVSMVEENLGGPIAPGLWGHLVYGGIPLVKVSNDADLFGIRSVKGEIVSVDRPFGGISVQTVASIL